MEEHAPSSPAEARLTSERKSLRSTADSLSSNAASWRARKFLFSCRRHMSACSFLLVSSSPAGAALCSWLALRGSMRLLLELHDARVLPDHQLSERLHHLSDRQDQAQACSAVVGGSTPRLAHDI
eukprot:4243211-Prymnesium_polylepis.1